MTRDRSPCPGVETLDFDRPRLVPAGCLHGGGCPVTAGQGGHLVPFGEQGGQDT